MQRIRKRKRVYAKNQELFLDHKKFPVPVFRNRMNYTDVIPDRCLASRTFTAFTNGKLLLPNMSLFFCCD